LQPHVEHHKRWLAAAEGVECFVAVARGAHLVAVVLENTGDEIADVGFVVDDENI
jgi:hypothetical protein